MKLGKFGQYYEQSASIKKYLSKEWPRFMKNCESPIKKKWIKVCGNI